MVGKTLQFAPKSTSIYINKPSPTIYLQDVKYKYEIYPIFQLWTKI